MNAKHQIRKDISALLPQYPSNFSEMDHSLLTTHYSLRQKFAFTLAEVLITLGIIGVVAALTLPNLIANHRAKELEAGLKKSSSVIQQALEMANAENGEPLTPESVNCFKFKHILVPYLKVLKDCGSGTEIGSCVPNPEAGPFRGEATATYKTYNKYTDASHSTLDDGQLLLSDGSFLYFENSCEVGSRVYISVDVNGYKKGPNIWGHDLFTFQLMDNGKLLPMGAPGTTWTNMCSRTSSERYNGIGCTSKALSDPSYFKTLP